MHCCTAVSDPGHVESAPAPHAVLIPSCSRSWKYAGKAQPPPSDCDVDGVAGYCNEENDDCEEGSRPVFTGTCPDDASDMCCIPIAPISVPPPSDCDVDGAQRGTRRTSALASAEQAQCELA